MDTPKHYFLTTIELWFVTNDGANTGCKNVNVLIVSDHEHLTTKLLSGAQAGAPEMLVAKLGNTDFQVVDSTYLNVSYIGEMTKAEFYAGMPELAAEQGVAGHA